MFACYCINYNGYFFFIEHSGCVVVKTHSPHNSFWNCKVKNLASLISVFCCFYSNSQGWYWLRCISNAWCTRQRHKVNQGRLFFIIRVRIYWNFIYLRYKDFGGVTTCIWQALLFLSIRFKFSFHFSLFFSLPFNYLFFLQN